jgi:hypothetical protein
VRLYDVLLAGKQKEVRRRQLAPADFFLFPRLESFMKGARFAERSTAVLRSILKESFADSFQKLYECCQNCVVRDDDYFEGQ